MLGQKDRGQPELFVAGSLRALLPDDHILVRVDRVLDLSWLRAEVADLQAENTRLDRKRRKHKSRLRQFGRDVA